VPVEPEVERERQEGQDPEGEVEGGNLDLDVAAHDSLGGVVVELLEGALSRAASAAREGGTVPHPFP
jgi:hypothetical protein